MKLKKAAKILREGIEESLSYHAFPREHHRSLRTNNMLERIMKELRRRTKVVGAFPDGDSALMLCCARLRHIESKSWSDSRKYLDMDKLRELDMSKCTGEESESYSQSELDFRVLRETLCMPNGNKLENFFICRRHELTYFLIKSYRKIGL